MNLIGRSRKSEQGLCCQYIHAADDAWSSGLVAAVVSRQITCQCLWRVSCLYWRHNSRSLWSLGTELNLSPQKLSLAGAATSIIFIATNVLLQQTGVCHNKHMFVATKHVICHNESMLAATNLTLLQQKYACHDKKNYDKHVFIAAKVLSQVYFCHDTSLLSWQTAVCRDKGKLVLSRQNYACWDKYVSRQRFCHDKVLNMFFTTRKLCCDKHTFVMTKVMFCQDKQVFVAATFVMTKMILVAAPTKDKKNYLIIERQTKIV